MAAVTTALSVAGGVAGLGMNVAQAIKAKKDKESAQKAAKMASAALKGVKEQDAFAQVQVPTLGYELAQQSMDRSTKGAMEAARGAGAEGVIGATGSILQAGNEAALNLAAQAGETAFNRDLYQAQNKAAIEQRRATREADIYATELTGAQQAAADAQATRNAAITGAVETGIGLAGDIYGATNLYKKQNDRAANSMSLMNAMGGLQRNAGEESAQMNPSVSTNENGNNINDIISLFKYLNYPGLNNQVFKK
jgi:hypothetical protein